MYILLFDMIFNVCFSKATTKATQLRHFQRFKKKVIIMKGEQ